MNRCWHCGIKSWRGGGSSFASKLLTGRGIRIVCAMRPAGVGRSGGVLQGSGKMRADAGCSFGGRQYPLIESVAYVAALGWIFNHDVTHKVTA